jgi:uncharacterized membrane protein YgcG
MRETVIRGVCSTLLVSLCSCSAFNGVINGEPNFDPGILLPPEAASSLHVAFPTEFPNQMTLPPTCVSAYGTPPSKYDRDVCVDELMAMIDTQYDEYKKSFRQATDDSNLAADIAVIGLGSAGALVPAKTTKAILSATAAAVTGAKAAVDSDVFYNSSILVVINQMDTDRQNERCLITKLLKNDVPSTHPSSIPTTLTMTTTTTVTAANSNKPTIKQTTMTPNISPSPPTTYSMYEASGDLVAYYQAGTFTHALQSLQAKTGSQAVAAKQQVKDQKTGNSSSSTPSTGPSSGSSPSGSGPSSTGNGSSSVQCSS